MKEGRQRMLKTDNQPIFDGLGRRIKELVPGVRYTMVDHGYYTTALKPGETDSVKPVIPRAEEQYHDIQHGLKHQH